MEKEMYVKPSAEVVMYDSSDIIATQSGSSSVCVFYNYSGNCLAGNPGMGIICTERQGIFSPDNGDSSFG